MASSKINSREEAEERLTMMLLFSEDDPWMTENDLKVYEVLSSVAITMRPPSVELAAAQEWLAGRAGITRRQVQTSLRHLNELGYLKPITFKQITRHGLKAWALHRRRQGLRLPGFVKLAQEVPNRELPDYLPA
jgi:hypothetical protein